MLVAEVVSGELARGLGLPVPELVTVELDPALGVAEPDQEVQDLLRRSPGLNLGMDFLPGALDLDPGAFPVDPGFAGRVLWFDALVGNVDRTWRNVNMLRWHGAPYLIDHGATLTFHHGWSGPSRPRSWRRGRAAVRRVGARPAPRRRARSRRGRRRARAAADPRTGARRRSRSCPTAGWTCRASPTPRRSRDAYVTRLLARRDARDAWLPPLREASRTGRRGSARRPARRPARDLEAAP